MKSAAHTRRAIVAHSIPSVIFGIHGSLLTEIGSAANFCRGLPEHLGEMTPALEVRHVRSGLAVVVVAELSELAIVPEITNGHLEGTDIA